ncbi:hypothetical protein SteCoe_7280 [Stentor coeruleus]|uniref:PA domain-containing protein n=1 Tax=Stentor coeruleus TaxID=5963 RepID=A0A1R2CN25_9CILI|nr:hypothetical protein SteCoe_7280 [Stentor coeruleus]
MCLILFLIQYATGVLQVITPTNFPLVFINTIQANFGNPSLLKTYAKLIKITSQECIITTDNHSHDTFIVVYNWIDCDIIKLAKSIQNSRAQGMILVYDKDIENSNIIFSNDQKKDEITIIVLGISKSSGDMIKIKADGEIWITYQYASFTKFESPHIELGLSLDFNLDKPFIKSFQEFIGNFTQTVFLESISVKLINFYKKYNSTDCIYYNSSDYICADTSLSDISGSSKLNIIVLFLNAYSNVKTINDFSSLLSSLLDYYSLCENNVAIECAISVLNKYNLSIIYDITILENNIYSTYASPWFYLNSYYKLYWNEYLENAYCLTLKNSQNICQNYDQTCSYEDLKDKNCKQNCNTSYSNYDNLRCLYEKNCYSFLLGDGFCQDSICINDPDCEKSKDIERFADDLKLLRTILPIIVGVYL